MKGGKKLKIKKLWCKNCSDTTNHIKLIYNFRCLLCGKMSDTKKGVKTKEKDFFRELE